jgi:hypothetical protein
VTFDLEWSPSEADFLQPLPEGRMSMANSPITQLFMRIAREVLQEAPLLRKATSSQNSQE